MPFMAFFLAIDLACTIATVLPEATTPSTPASPRGAMVKTWKICSTSIPYWDPSNDSNAYMYSYQRIDDHLL
jgi:hypothetical protein